MTHVMVDMTKVNRVFDAAAAYARQRGKDAEDYRTKEEMAFVAIILSNSANRRKFAGDPAMMELVHEWADLVDGDATLTRQ